MIIVPDIKTRNFTLKEIIHRPNDLDHPIQVQIGLVALGYMQGLRDYLAEKYNREIRLTIASGCRSKQYNASLGNSAPNSYHMWRVDPVTGQLVWANDFNSPDMPIEALAKEVAKFSRGETYIHTKMGFVHNAPFGTDEEFRI